MEQVHVEVAPLEGQGIDGAQGVSEGREGPCDVDAARVAQAAEAESEGVEAARKLKVESMVDGPLVALSLSASWLQYMQ
ncbi:hypothetical protein GCM10025867_50560 (plasmid) [Frondihabitans sucicola]|uniref:Uncharacterized protein n=1 Tax=Frondihabitans sucicola TaxID=1268041 RepID=A0ABM8GWG7_9MICO|nr:hypothetical protein [Frondihabitans sucicola]BDZ52815.1 hypothetical protein GCM10025867_50560 [Frondihabitans sucicola]